MLRLLLDQPHLLRFADRCFPQVRTPLPKKSLAEEDLRTHLRTYAWESCGQTILEDVVRDGQLRHPVLFPDFETEEKSHLSSYQVFDVGPDGAPLSIDLETEEEEETQSKSAAFWNVIKVRGNFLGSLPLIRVRKIHTHYQAAMGGCRCNLNLHRMSRHTIRTIYLA